jgi:hypothetical protein
VSLCHAGGPCSQLLHDNIIVRPAQQLMTHLITASPHPNTKVAAANAQFVHTLLAMWRSAVPVPG